MSNFIIVESKNDEYFIEAFIKKLNSDNSTKIDKIIYEYKCLEGYTNLNKILYEIKEYRYENIGIILDANDEGIEKKLKYINEHWGKIHKENINIKINKLTNSKKLNSNIACYIMNINGCGELDTVLKTIKSEPSEYADCLDSWRNCLEKEGKKISKKDFDKFWVSNYLRFDTCSKKEMQQAYKNCGRKKAMEKNIWNFEHDALVNLKVFLELFK